MFGAEGATAPETLRQTDRKEEAALESGAPQEMARCTEGVSRRIAARHRASVNLSGQKTEGVTAVGWDSRRP